jgi:hypothetical protein
LRHLILILSTLVLTACGGSGGSPSASNITVPAVVPGTSPDLVAPTPTPAPVEVVTVYSLTTSTPVAGIGTYTATAKCVLYEASTYCWDDGKQTLSIHPGGIFHYYNFTFFGLDDTSGIAQCSGDCNNDPLLEPTLMTQDILSLVDVSTVNDVFSQGTHQDENCTLVNNNLNCVDFTIDLGQVPL